MNSLFRVIAKARLIKVNSSFSCFIDKKFFSSNHYSYNDDRSNRNRASQHGRRISTDHNQSENNLNTLLEEFEASNDSSSSSLNTNPNTNTNQNPNSRRSQVTWLNRYNKMRKYNTHEDLQLFKQHKERKLLKQEGIYNSYHQLISILRWN